MIRDGLNGNPENWCKGKVVANLKGGTVIWVEYKSQGEKYMAAGSIDDGKIMPIDADVRSVMAFGEGVLGYMHLMRP